jgi:elongation factor G
VKTYPTDRIRNVILLGHGGSGKTSLTEALLFTAGAITRMGTTTEGNTVSDYDPAEVAKQISISLSLGPIEWKEHKINVLDAPGYADFIGDAEAGLRAADAAIIVVSAVEGLEVQARAMWEEAEHLGVPRAIFINKLDRERASFQRTLDELTEAFGTKVAPMQLPVGEEHDFKAVVDLLNGEPPAELAEQATTLREKLVESVVEADDALMERYLEGGDIEPKELISALEKAVAAGITVPVLCGSATKAIGVDLLAEFIVDAIPSPAHRAPAVATKGGAEIELAPDPNGPLGALVFKTLSDPYVGRITFFRVFSGTMRPDSTLFNATHNSEERIGQLFTMRGKTHDQVSEVPAGDIAALAKLAHTTTGDTLCLKADPIVIPGLELPEPLFALAIEPKTKGDEDKMSTALHKLAAEDPTFRWDRNPDTHQTVIHGMGEAHLDVIVDRLHRHHVEVNTFPPRVPYLETIKGSAQGHGRYVKQTGGRGQYAQAWLELEPLPRGSGVEFVKKIVGGSIPNQFIPSVEKGVHKAVEEGVIAHHRVTDVRATLYDGKFHPVDSSDIAFQMAGILGFKDAAQKAGVVLLEPIMDLEVMIPDDSTGDVMGDLSSKRARIEGTEAVGRGWNTIRAKVPHSELLRYTIDLRSKTGGRGSFKMSFSHYEDVPAHVQEKIVAEAQKEKEAAEKK